MVARRNRLFVLVVVVGVLAVSCTSGGSTSNTAGGATSTAAGGVNAGATNTSGLIPEAQWKARQDDYLAFATKDGLSPGSLNSILVNGERARRDPSFTWDAKKPQPSDFTEMFAKLKRMDDTSDFDLNDMLFVWYQDRTELDPALVSAFEERILAFKYWWTEPTPPGVTDSQYYWTENHQIIFLANEYLAGQAFPDKTFTNSGMTGKQHMEHAAPLIKRWVELRARFGWAEWLSNVYYMEDLKGLLLLAEWSDDASLATQASMCTDLILYEMAAHTQNGAFGATHGRSYMKDKMTALDEDTFSMAKMLFDDTAYPYQHLDGAALLATAHKYRPPEVVRKIASSTEVSVDKSQAGIPLDVTAPVTPDPKPPYGFSYSDPDNLMVWWGMGAQFAWPLVPLSVDTIKKYNLWDTENFQQAAALRPIVDSSTSEQLQSLAQTLAKQVNAGLLSQVDTYTWRSPEAMLSTAQDWRPGQRTEQGHIWQATLDANAQVFTGHPYEPVPNGTDWHTNSGYWTGEGAAPRSAQINNVGISIYAPQYTSTDTGPLAQLGYEPYTHAYFPQDAFDEIVQKGNWTFGRKGDGYVALYSWRPTRWVTYDPTQHPTRGMQKPFELMADGGPDNVWMVEVGQASVWKDKATGGATPFQAFVDAVAGAKVDVQSLFTGAMPSCPPPAQPQPTGWNCAHQPGDGFDVTYTSPTQGEISYGWTKPFTVKGTTVEQHNYKRYDSPWAQVDFDTKRYRITAAGSSLDLDFTTGTRTAT